LVVLLGVLVYYRVAPTWNLLLLPLFFTVMLTIPTGIGMWLAALAIRFRDVRFVMPFVIRMLVYSAPILYTASALSEPARLLYSLNPLVAVVEGYRACLLGTPVPWAYVVPGMIVSLIVLVLGGIYFRRMERVFVDVI
jgi:lipopolysaccharide transport system permease protein